MKRLFDLVFVVITLPFLLPILFIVGILVRIQIGSPVFFKQVRPGLFGQPFTIFKFRTMTKDSTFDGCLLCDFDRMTPLGSILRKLSIDELPELWNVLKGDMSLVGPRPLLMEYLDRYTPEQARRHEVKPGITGWAQINGRNAISWEQKFELDIWYVDHCSPWLDFKVLWLTFFKVVRREGIRAPGEATMPEFMGTQKKNEDVS